MSILSSFEIRRCITRADYFSPVPVSFELHGFCDGSGKAFAACVYIRSIDLQGRSTVNLVIAKAKVDPVKGETTPRLELCGALTLSQLMKVVLNSLRIKFNVARCWTDSTCVLGWLNSSEKLPMFVANRIRKILLNCPVEQWDHIPGTENPADLPSRGISARKLLNHPLWLQGPSIIRETKFEPNFNLSSNSVQIEDSPVGEFINNCSSLTRMKRVVAWILRFIKYAQKNCEDRGRLSVQELGVAQEIIVKLVQSDSFDEEIRLCKIKKQLKTPIKFLSPFLDEKGILRVGGRLLYSGLKQAQIHPILIPKKHNFTDALVRSFHQTHLHAGNQLLQSILRKEFWIVRGAEVVTKIIKKCVVCHRHSGRDTHQIMAPLPVPRCTPPLRPFVECGVDYAGPFILSLRTGRKPPMTKAWVSLFICLATRAIHLELVMDLTTEAFIAAFTRFISRRGRPDNLYSDDGTNFVGASNEMKEFYAFYETKQTQKVLADFFSGKEIMFNFNPPRAPHHGGLWEAGVKSMKHHLKRVMDDKILTIEEFGTLLTQVEACLNSRPLTPLSTDPNDMEALTPAHFLMSGSLQLLPKHDITHIKQNRLSRWQVVQQMSQHVWKRWSSDYLTLLQKRPKWFQPQPNIEKGTLVLVRDDDPAWGPLNWKLGRVSEVFPGRDGNTRVCDVQTIKILEEVDKDGLPKVYKKIFRRRIVKLSPLPIYGNEFGP